MSDADVKMPPLPEPAYWYVVDKHGAATLCADERDARKVAAECATDWPNLAPYRVVQLVTADQLRAAVLAERERCAKVCEEGASHGRHQMRTDPINTAFWNGYAAGADQCATDILESDHAD